MAHAQRVCRRASRIARARRRYAAARRACAASAVWIACACGASALLIACATSGPPADPDGTAAGAQAIELAPRADALRCEDDAQPDCADWFRFRVAEPGAWRVSVAPVAAGGSPSALGAPAPLELGIAEATGREIGRAKVAPGTPVAAIPIEVGAATDYVAMVTLPPGAGAAEYRLSFDKAPPRPAASPPAASRVARFTILEVQAEGGVLIDGGRQDGLRPGLRGRLRDGKRTLGQLVVVDVFDEGARARIEGPLSGEITPDTVAEIEGPADRR